MFGYNGRILFVDLSNRDFKIGKISEEDINNFVGGLGINIKLAHDYIKPNIDPLSPQNPIIIGTGPLVGTIIPSTCRSYITTKMPMNGVIGWGGGGMTFGPMLKYAGFDHIVIRGKADSPVYLKIVDEHVSLEDARNFWGLDSNQVSDKIWENLGESGIISIGQSGEHQIKFSIALIDRIATIGRGGLGAVMGFKNLKAVAVKGTKGIRVADPKRTMELYKEMFERIKKYPKREEWVNFGLIKTAQLVSKDFYLENLKKARLACPSCPIADKDVIKLKEGKFSGLVSYQTSVINSYMLMIMGFGSDYEMIKSFDLMNRYGLDAITITNMYPIIKSLFRRGLITEDDTEGIQIQNDYESFSKLLEQIANRTGIGKIIANGFNGLVEKYGKEAIRKVPITKGQSLILDPKILNLFPLIIRLSGSSGD